MYVCPYKHTCIPHKQTSYGLSGIHIGQLVRGRQEQQLQGVREIERTPPSIHERSYACGALFDRRLSGKVVCRYQCLYVSVGVRACASVNIDWP